MSVLGNRKRTLAGVLLLLLVVGAFLAGYGYGRGHVAAGGDADTYGFTLLRDILHQIRTTYLVRDVDSNKLFRGAAKGMLDALEDPYSRFLDQAAFKEYRSDLSGVVFGVGIFIELEGDRPVVVQPIPDTPAFRAGLRPGDRITAVNGITTEGMSLPEVVSRIRGPAGTQVRLHLTRDDRSFDVTLTRARIANVSVQAGQNLDPATRSQLDAAGATYVRLLMFNETTAKEFVKVVDAAIASGARGLLLDLRSNGGGLLDVAVDVANRFVPSGQAIVHTVDRSGRRQTERATGGSKVTIPVVILVNEFTASAAEILAGALMDNDIGTTVGQTTFGKGVIQTIITLPGSTGATLTSGKYLTPDGHDIHKKGITPSVVAGRKLKGLNDSQARAVEAEQFAKGLQVLKQAIARR